jgi:copper chaperone
MKFHIANMTCVSCARGITTAIKELDSNAPLDIDLQNRIVEINTTVSQIKSLQIPSERGFTADPANLC